MSILRKAWLKYVVGLAQLLVFYLLASLACRSATCSEQGYRLANMVGLVFLFSLSIIVIRRVLSRDQAFVLTPVVIFPLSVAIYFSFGNLLFVFGNADFLDGYSTHRYWITQPELLRANTLTTTGVLIVATSMLVSYRIRFMRRSEIELFASPRLDLPKTGLFLLFIGLSIESWEILLRLSQGPNASLPGLVQNLDVTTGLGLAVALYLGIKGKRLWYLVFWIIWLPYVAYSLLEFSKKDLMFAILLPAVGAYLAHGSTRRVLPFIVFAVVGFSTVQDVNTGSRIEVSAAVTEGRTFTLTDRLEVFLAQFKEHSRVYYIPSDEVVSQVWWQRLSYAGPQVRAMELYDTGRPTSWQVNPLVYFIPRAIWPDKPTMPALGREFNWEVAGNEDMTTRVGITIYANGYWMMGWPGVVLFAAIYGFILARVTRINHAIVAGRNFVFFPAVFLGISISSLSQMGFFETSVLGALSVYVGLLMVTRLGLIAASHYSVPRSRRDAAS